MRVSSFSMQRCFVAGLFARKVRRQHRNQARRTQPFLCVYAWAIAGLPCVPPRWARETRVARETASRGWSMFRKHAASPATDVSLYVRCVLVRPRWRGDHRWVVQGVCSVAYPTMLSLMHALSNWFPRVVVARGLDQWAVSEWLRGARSACAPMPWCCDGFLGLAFDWLVSVSRSFPQQAFL